MISQLLTASKGALLLPLAVIVVSVPLTKGLFGLLRSRAQDRRDFLELWLKGDPRDNLWLEVSVRHLFGTYLPAQVIRLAQLRSQSGLALLQVSESWPLLDFEESTGEVQWRFGRHASPRWRYWEWLGLSALYFLLMSGAALIGIYLLLSTTVSLQWVWWMWVVILIFAAIRCLWRADNLRVAHKAVPRWLGIS